MIGLTAVVVYEFATWFPQADAWQRRYFVHRCLFATATLIEFPVAELLLLGIAMRAFSGHRRPTRVQADQFPPAD